MIEENKSIINVFDGEIFVIQTPSEIIARIESADTFVELEYKKQLYKGHEKRTIYIAVDKIISIIKRD